MLEKLVKNTANVVLIAGLGVPTALIGQSRIEYMSMFADTAARVEAPNQLRRNFKHNLMVDHELVSGKVTARGEPMHGSYKGMKSEFTPYTIKTESGEIYNVASREQHPFNLGDNATVLLGWPISCECESPYRIIEAFQ